MFAGINGRTGASGRRALLLIVDREAMFAFEERVHVVEGLLWVRVRILANSTTLSQTSRS
jgi:hypothetical protein